MSTSSAPAVSFAPGSGSGVPSDISVAMATFNGARFLEAQLASIAAQTLRPAEVVVYDDGSDPLEVEAMREIVARFPGVTFIAGANIGITANFARAIAATTAPLVALADQDDVWTPNHLALLHAGLGDADLVYGDMLFMAEDGTMSTERFSDRIRTIGMTSRDPDLFEALLHNSIVWGSAALFRRELVAERSIPDTRRYHDWWLSILAVARGGVAYVDQVVTHHRIHAANSSHHREGAGAFGGLFGRNRRQRRNAKSATTLSCLQALATAGPVLTEPQHRALSKAVDYARSLVNDDRRLWRTAYAWRRRRLMAADASPLRQAAIALSKLL